jgi:hypothetical protein
MVDQTDLVVVYRGQMAKKLPDAQKGADVATVAEIAGAVPAPPVSWNDVQDKPAVIAAGADQASARTAIGAGTSNLALGATASTALAGNGTAVAATKLATARTINGKSFDGTANITIAPDDIQVGAFTTDGGALSFPGGTLTQALKAIADLADPGGA